MTNREYANWLKEYPDSVCGVMVTSHHECLRDGSNGSENEECALFEPCEILTEEEWLQGGLTPWVDDVGEEEVLAVHVDDTQEVEILPDTSRLENPLLFKTTSTGIIVGEDVKDYPHVPTDWYRNTNEQTHIAQTDWKQMKVKMKTAEVRQMRMGAQLPDEEIGSYKELIGKFSDVFAWSYHDLKGIPSDMVEHRIPLIPGARLIRQKERRMNPRLQLLVKTELERLLKAGFIWPVEITDWVSPMVLVMKKNGKLRVCADYQKLNACTQKDHFPLPFISLLLEEVRGHACYTFMDGYAGYNQISISLGDLHKTAFTTLWCTFIWLVMPFRLCNAPAIFQRLVIFIFSVLLYKSMMVFVDDFSTQSNEGHHLECMRKALKRCRATMLALNPLGMLYI